MNMSSDNEVPVHSTVCSTVTCPVTEALYYRLLLAVNECNLESFDPECITAIHLGLQECIKSVVRVMVTEQRISKYGESLRKNRNLKQPYPPPFHEKAFTLRDFYSSLEMHSQAIGKPSIYYNFMERIKLKLNESNLEKKKY